METTQTVYRLDLEGFLIEELTVTAGHLPCDTTHVPPPACGAGERPRWVRGRWHLQPAPADAVAQGPVVVTEGAGTSA